MIVGPLVGVVGQQDHNDAENAPEILERATPHLFEQAVELVLGAQGENGEQPHCRVGTNDEEANDYDDPKDQGAENPLLHSKRAN